MPKPKPKPIVIGPGNSLRGVMGDVASHSLVRGVKTPVYYVLVQVNSVLNLVMLIVWNNRSPDHDYGTRVGKEVYTLYYGCRTCGRVKHGKGEWMDKARGKWMSEVMCPKCRVFSSDPTLMRPMILGGNLYITNLFILRWKQVEFYDRIFHAPEVKCQECKGLYPGGVWSKLCPKCTRKKGHSLDSPPRRNVSQPNTWLIGLEEISQMVRKHGGIGLANVVQAKRDIVAKFLPPVITCIVFKYLPQDAPYTSFRNATPEQLDRVRVFFESEQEK